MDNFTPLTNTEILSNLTFNQVDILMSKAKVKVLLQGRQSGKTTTLRTLLYKKALEHAGCEILVVAVTHRQVKENLFRPLFMSSVPLFPKELIKSINQTDLSVELVNGSRIVFSGTEAVDNLLGRTLDYLIMDEFQSIDEKVFMLLQPMIAARNGDIVIAGTVRGYNHMWEFYWKGAKENPERVPNWRSWKVTTANSGTPAGRPDSIIAAKAALSPQQFAQEYECNPSAMKGAVYAGFDTTLNNSVLQLDKNLPLHIGCDFNVGKMCWVVAQRIITDEILPNGQRKRTEHLHVIEELMVENTNTQAMCNTFASRYGAWKGRWIAYPDASGSAHKTAAIKNSTDHSIMRQSGFTIMAPSKNPEINDRVNAVNAKLCNANDERFIYVNTKDCPDLVKSLVGQAYDRSGKPEKKPGEQDLSGPVDALGYMVNYLYPITSSFGVSNVYGHR